MGRRKVRTAKSSLPPPENGENERDRDQEEEEQQEQEGGRFFACYLLTSLCPRFKGHTYIGFTVNPRRRIRQHNGEIGCGAWRTKKKRPWEMVLCIYGFPTNVVALQFEWAWQHPVESLAVRKAATSFKSVNGLANKIKLAYTMLTLPSWQSLNLTVNFFSTKYQIHACGCPSLPRQMRSKLGSMDELPCYNENVLLDDDGWDGDEECNAIDSLQEQKRDISTNATEQVHTSGSSEEYVHYQPTREASTGVTEQVHSSGSSEEYFHHQMSQKDGSRGSPGLPGENLAEASDSSPVREKYPGWSAMGYDTPAKTFSSYVSSYDAKDFQTSTPEDHFSTEFNHSVTYELTFSSYVSSYDAKDFQTSTPEDHFSTEFDHSVRRSSAALFAENDEVYIKSPPGVYGHQSEVIDLITPSPCYTNKLANKKMKTNSSTEVIDLTTSPMFV